jgi:hypothetical protein
MEDAMKPTLPLILSAIAFGLIWSGWVVFLNHEPDTLAITAVCALVASSLWFLIMRWCFRLMRLLPRIGAGSSAAR